MRSEEASDEIDCGYFVKDAKRWKPKIFHESPKSLYSILILDELRRLFFQELPDLGTPQQLGEYPLLSSNSLSSLHHASSGTCFPSELVIRGWNHPLVNNSIPRHSVPVVLYANGVMISIRGSREFDNYVRRIGIKCVFDKLDDGSVAVLNQITANCENMPSCGPNPEKLVSILFHTFIA
jgi:hypothetical protein